MPKRSDVRPSVLAVHHAAGVSKKSKPPRKSRMSSKMRRRHEKGLEMAEAVTERTGKKIERSISRAQAVQKRSRAWDDVNKDVQAQEAADSSGGGRFAALMEEEDDAGWETDQEVQADDGFNPQNPAASTKPPDADEDEDDGID